MAGLKPAYGGSIPPFLVSVRPALVQMRALQMCGREEGSRVVIQYWLQLIQLTALLAWRQMLLIG